MNGCKAVPIWYKDTVAFIKVNLLPGKFCDTGVLVRVHGFYIQVTKPSLFIPPSFFNLLLVSLQTCSWILVISHVQSWSKEIFHEQLFSTHPSICTIMTVFFLAILWGTVLRICNKYSKYAKSFVFILFEFTFSIH